MNKKIRKKSTEIRSERASQNLGQQKRLFLTVIQITQSNQKNVPQNQKRKKKHRNYHGIHFLRKTQLRATSMEVEPALLSENVCV